MEACSGGRAQQRSGGGGVFLVGRFPQPQGTRLEEGTKCLVASPRLELCARMGEPGWHAGS